MLLQAVLMETQRYANIVPVGGPHVSDRDIPVKGVTIPAFTLIQVCISVSQSVTQLELQQKTFDEW